MIKVTLKYLIFFVFVGTSSQVFAEDDLDIPFLDIRLMGTDLVDEFAYSWKTDLPFPKNTNLVLADISAPVGLDDRFQDLVENRLYEVFITHKQAEINFVRCSICTQWVTKSNATATYIAKGIDQPEIIESIRLQNPNSLALSLNFEAEGRELVLRAQVFEITRDQKIVWAKRFTTSRSARRLLRKAEPLISIEQAREEQNLILLGRDPSEFVTRLSIRNFSGKDSTQTPIPIMFAEQSFETTMLPQKKYKGALTLGFASVRSALEGWSAGGHLSSLMLRNTPSLSQPDLYWFMGFHYMRLRGPTAAVFQQGQLDIDQLLGGPEPKVSLVGWRLGVELFVKYRLGVNVFIEYIPVLNNNEAIAKNHIVGIPYHDWGMSMVIKW